MAGGLLGADAGGTHPRQPPFPAQLDVLRTRPRRQVRAVRAPTLPRPSHPRSSRTVTAPVCAPHFPVLTWHLHSEGTAGWTSSAAVTAALAQLAEAGLVDPHPALDAQNCPLGAQVGLLKRSRPSMPHLSAARMPKRSRTSAPWCWRRLGLAKESVSRYKGCHADSPRRPAPRGCCLPHARAPSSGRTYPFQIPKHMGAF